MTIKDLIKGEIYYGKGEHEHIFIYKDSGRRIINSKKLSNHNTDSLSYEYLHYLRDATDDEKHWLKVCRAEGKFIEKDVALKSIKFQVGKWYKYISPLGEYIARFKRIFEEAFTTDTGYIYKGIYKLDNTNGKIWSIINPCVEIPVEEIQEYLPDNHPDKIKSFQVHRKCNIGDIIVSLEPHSKDVCTRNNGDLFKVLERSNDEKLYYGDAFLISKRNSHTYRLATPQEIEMYNKGIKNIYDVKEEKYEVGKWYIYSTDSMIGCYQGNSKAYGITTNNRWTDSLSMSDDNWKEATTEQVEEVLLKEAKRRYPVGSVYNPIDEKGNDSPFYSFEVDDIFKPYIHAPKMVALKHGKGLVYANGVWAKVVSSQETKQPFKVGDKLTGKSRSGNNITESSNPLGIRGKYFIADEIEYVDNCVKLWSEGYYWTCDISDISLYEEKKEYPVTMEAAFDPFEDKVSELILKEDEPIIFPNIKREKIVEIKLIN